MNNSIVKIDADNYPLFDDMIFWRENGYERTPSGQPVSEQIKRELANNEREEEDNLNENYKYC